MSVRPPTEEDSVGITDACDLETGKTDCWSFTPVGKRKN